METSAASGASGMADASAADALGYSPAERDRLRRQPDVSGAAPWWQGCRQETGLRADAPAARR